MKWVFALALLGFALPLCAAAPVKSKSSHKSSLRTGHGRSLKRTRLSHLTPGPSYQLHPDPERYQEIQKALADKGYFKGDVNGQWGDDSVDALKRFQADQKLANDGKINALSLIGLGLGPRHDGEDASPAAPPQ